MAQFYSILLFVVFLSLADAGLRIRRSPRFNQASASSGSFGNYPREFGEPNLELTRPPPIGRGGLRIRRSPQFNQASASSGSFGNYPREFGEPNFGLTRPPPFGIGGVSGRSFGSDPRGFGELNFGPPRPPVFARGPQFGERPPVFGPPRFGDSGFERPRPGATINISKSVSISTGGRGGGARSSAGGFGK